MKMFIKGCAFDAASYSPASPPPSGQNGKCAQLFAEAIYLIHIS